jgi:hypothetical protein
MPGLYRPAGTLTREVFVDFRSSLRLQTAQTRLGVHSGQTTARIEKGGTGIMIRKSAVLGSAFGFLLGVLAISPSNSGAASPPFDTSGATITCNTVIGTATVNPPISTASTGSATIKVKAVLGGCVATGATPAGLTIVSGSVAGTLTTAGAAGCAGLLLPSTITGNLVAKWKVGPGQKLDFASTTVAGGTIVGGVFTGVPLTGSYGQFTVSGETMGANSAFAAGVPSIIAVTGEDVGNLAGLCASSPPGKGIKTIHLSIGQLTL